MDSYNDLILVQGADNLYVGDPRHESLANRVTTLEAGGGGGTSAAAVPPALLHIRGMLDRAKQRPVQVFVGGSSTSKGGVSTGAARWADVLLSKLQAAHPSGGAESAVVYTSHTTDTTNGVHCYNYGADAQAASAYNPAPAMQARATDIGIHIIGSNDKLAGTSAAAYESVMRTMLDNCDTVITGPVVHVLCQQQPRLIWTDAEWAPYGQALANIAADRPDDVLYLNFGAVFEAMRRNGDTSGYASDGIHLDDEGNATLAGFLYRAFL